MTNVPGADFVALLAVHAGAIVSGVTALGVVAPFGIDTLSPEAAAGLLRFTLGVLAVGLAVAGVAAGGPIAAGAVIATLVGGVPWRRGVWYATVGHAGGGLVGALAGLTATGRIEAAAAGSVLAAPAALRGVGFERAGRSDRRSTAS